MIDSAPQNQARAEPARNLSVRRSGMQELGLMGVILMLGALLTLFGGSTERRWRDPETGKDFRSVRNKFLNVDRLLTLAKNTSFFAIMAIGATVVIVAGGIDLSVAGIYVLSGLAGAVLLHEFGPAGRWPDLPGIVVVLVTMAACLGTGAVCGLINGLGVIGLRLHPFLITLGTMSIFRGIAFVTTKAQSIGQFHPAFVDGFISRRFPLWGGKDEFIYPIPLLVLIAVGVWGSVYLARTVTGRKLHAIGGNEIAARYAGLAVPRLKAMTYVLAGLTAGIAAMINIGYHGSAASGDGQGYELEVIAAAVVGGASLAGGRGTALGALLGALIIRLIVDGIVILDLDQNYSQIIVGSVIVLAATLDKAQSAWRGAGAT
ncbi:MAG TPA: ABC transporter permease [Planctomycetaceae bacterium]|nr:ABC transporter permease [Planctomycetaceae bacterium]